MLKGNTDFAILNSPVSQVHFLTVKQYDNVGKADLSFANMTRRLRNGRNHDF